MKYQVTSIETKVLRASAKHLAQFSLAELRRYAKSIGVKTGRTKAETVKNLIASGSTTICASLGD